MKIKQFVYISDINSFLSKNYYDCFNLLDNDSMKDYEGWYLVGEVIIEVSDNHEAMIAEAVRKINEAEEREIAEHEVKMKLLKEKKASFLAITHQPDIVDNFDDIPYEHLL